MSVTMGRVWDADLSVDVRDEYALSERIMDGIRFDISHETNNGRPRPRVLVTNPFDPHDKVNFPQPVKSRCAWTQRKREREEAMQLISHDADKTCERDFDVTLDALVERDAALLRDDFSAERPLVACLGYTMAPTTSLMCAARHPPTTHRDGTAAATSSPPAPSPLPPPPCALLPSPPTCCER